jgi:hypothetical protein
MKEQPTQQKPLLSRICAGVCASISTDWWAVIIGLALTALVWLGVIANVPWPLFGLLK